MLPGRPEAARTPHPGLPSSASNSSGVIHRPGAVGAEAHSVDTMMAVLEQVLLVFPLFSGKPCLRDSASCAPDAGTHGPFAPTRV